MSNSIFIDSSILVEYYKGLNTELFEALLTGEPPSEVVNFGNDMIIEGTEDKDFNFR